MFNDFFEIHPLQSDVNKSDRDPVVLALLALLEKNMMANPDKLIPLDSELADLMNEFAELDSEGV